MQRDIAVSPWNQEAKEILAPVNDGFGDNKNEAGDDPEESVDAGNEWEELADNYEDLEAKANEYLNDEQTLGMRTHQL